MLLCICTIITRTGTNLEAVGRSVPARLQNCVDSYC